MRSSLLVVAAALAVASCGPSGPQAGGSPVASASSAAHKAADQFTALAGDSAHTGNAPRETDTAAAPLLTTVFDTHALTGVTPAFDQLDPVNDWLLSINRVGQVYVLAGTGVTDMSKAASARPDQIAKNTVTYAPELGRYLDAELAVSAVEARAVTKELASNPGLTNDATRAKGLNDMRGGVASIVNGVLTSLPTDGLTDEWREARMKALIASTPDFAALLPAETAATLKGTAAQVAAMSSDPTLKAQLTNFEDLISKQSAPK